MSLSVAVALALSLTHKYADTQTLMQTQTDRQGEVASDPTLVRTAVEGYLTNKKPPLPGTLQQDHA